MPPNVNLLRDYLDDAAYRQLQNEHRFHLCPSATEGYGHYIAEAMSCGALVITLDAEPMNELVTSERGVLVSAQPAGKQGLATLYAFEPIAMAAAIENCIAMTDAGAAELGASARTWYDQQSGLLAARLRDALSAIGVPAVHGAR
jgi:glycosyltransferase involved in cell wall biosynthesis